MINKISIIIPTYNEAENIAALINYLKSNSKNSIAEIIVTDGGSTDETIALASSSGAITFTSPQKGRAAQMNYGASKASGDILYFVHADTFPPVSFATDIIEAVKNNFDCGRYQTKFNSKKWIYKFNAFFTRFDWFICYGGDQTFFITQKLFTALDGFKNDMLIMEEYDLTARAKQKGHYKIFNKTTLISIRKYEGRSWWQVQMANRKAIQLFKSGASQQQIVDQYKLMLKK
ncbi:TIGR04283 family arsenosugar biosynthesis glycosyltransferase [Ferruginibacter sp.]